MTEMPIFRNRYKKEEELKPFSSNEPVQMKFEIKEHINTR